ncbi:winged helix-turn-helix transcriptional regulator [Candidatus Bathyarchaeota archaeon]|nr:winged helix-turn-helix transcriptional regulator [Candidatus Bathyarchaeota archaeon]
MSEPWFTGVSPKERMEISARKILKLLEEEEKPFSTLARTAEKQGISRATLTKHLKRLMALGLVSRRVDASTYPPTVYYRRIKGETPIILMPFEVWRAWIGEYPPKPEEGLEETLKWVQAILHLIMAKVVSTLTPPPFFLGQSLSENEIEEWWRSQKFENQFKLLYEQLVETALDICKATFTNKQKLLTINETLKLTYFSLLEEALKLYGLNFEKVAEKIRKGETPKVTRPIKAYFSTLKPNT